MPQDSRKKEKKASNDMIRGINVGIKFPL